MAMAAARIKTAFRRAANPGGGLAPLLRDDPSADFRGPRSTPAEAEVLTRAQAAARLRWLRSKATTEADRRYLLLQRTLIWTGARPSELTRATWREISWDAGRTATGAAFAVLIRREWKHSRKTGQAQDDRPPALDPPGPDEAARPRRGGPSDPMRVAPIGSEWTLDALVGATRYKRRKAAAEGAGRIRGYALRHVAATELLRQGVDSLTAANLLGTSVQMLEETYAHLDLGDLAAAAQASRRGRITRPRGGGPGSGAG
ncbi:hypothetical protein [Paludisphaera soli]|uniref:hypothetical protein n=1 Tax=Paludisphaera soli TaxID=2712865 RepID=UPI0013EA6B96|nr:hypothetical protein [Paludisphaera soli]